MESFIVILLIITICGIVAYSSIYRHYAEVIEQKSTSLSLANEINKKYEFHTDIQKTYTYKKSCNSKQQFDRFDYSKYMLAIISDRLSYFQGIIEKATRNQEINTEYTKEYDLTTPKISEKSAKQLGVPLYFLERIEPRLHKKLRKSPVESPSIIIHASYTSPQGRNSYSNSRAFDLRFHIQTAQKIIQQKETVQYQRNLMSDSLRYDIMLRDSFTCQLCGANQNDGVKLHVDHIHPVSKGGKTVASNLRTLCERCNRGKGAKIET